MKDKFYLLILFYIILAPATSFSIDWCTNPIRTPTTHKFFEEWQEQRIIEKCIEQKIREAEQKMERQRKIEEYLQNPTVSDPKPRPTPSYKYENTLEKEEIIYSKPVNNDNNSKKIRIEKDENGNTIISNTQYKQPSSELKNPDN